MDEPAIDYSGRTRPHTTEKRVRLGGEKREKDTHCCGASDRKERRQPNKREGRPSQNQP
jgi:hypothetical protein